MWSRAPQTKITLMWLQFNIIDGAGKCCEKTTLFPPLSLFMKQSVCCWRNFVSIPYYFYLCNLLVFLRSSRGGSYFCPGRQKYAKAPFLPGKAERSKNYRFSLYLYLNSLPFPAHPCSRNRSLPIGNFHISTLFLIAALFRASLFTTAFYVEWPLLYLCLYALYISHCFPLQFTPEPNP